MLANHLRIAFRSLLKNRLYSFLNILGLSVGLAGGILVLLWVSHEWSFNRFHGNLEKIHVILQNQTQGGETYTFQALPGPLATGLRTEFPEVEWATRTSWNSKYLLSVGEKKTYERGIYAEPDFFNIFNFPVIAGNPVRPCVNQALLSSPNARQKILWQGRPHWKNHPGGKRKRPESSGRASQYSTNSTLRFDVIMPFNVIEQRNLPEINSNWGQQLLANLGQPAPKNRFGGPERKIGKLHSREKPGRRSTCLGLPTVGISPAGKFKEGKPDGGRIQIITLLGIVGLFVLLIACVNFMNLATARSAGRAREVGVRKGGWRSPDFDCGSVLTEAMVMTFLALFLSIVWVKLLLPGFNTWPKKN
jgi:putative ABC transport system permease protein